MSSIRHQMIYFLVILTRFHFSSSVWQYSHGLKKLCVNKTKHLFCVENLFVLNLSLVIVENPIWVRILNNITQSNALQQFCLKCFSHLKCAWALAVKEMLMWTLNIEIDPKSSHCNMHILVCVQDTQLVCLWSKIQPSCILAKLHLRCLLQWNGLQAHFYNILCDMEMSTMLLLTAFIHYIIFFWKIKSLRNIWNYILHGFTCIMNKEWETAVQLQNCHIMAASWRKTRLECGRLYKPVSIFCLDPQLGPTFTDIWPPSHVECVRL